MSPQGIGTGNTREKGDKKMQGNKLPLDFEGGKTFFCRGHLEDRPVGEASPDPRYCRFCFDFLQKEAELLLPGRYPKWLPKGVTAPQAPLTTLTLAGQKSEQHKDTPTVEKGVLSTPNANGRPHLDLPEDKIRELAATGLGPKGIAAILCDRGVMVSSRTIKRMLLTFAGVGKTEGD